MAEIGQETVNFASLVGRAAEDSYTSLKELVDKSKSSELSDSEKKIMILKYIVKTQQRLLRLNVLSKWCQQIPLIQYCQQLASTLSSHDTCFTQAADSLFFMHEGLQQARAPIYDIPSATEVLLSGTYQRLPKCVEDMGTQSTLNEDQQAPVLKKLDMLVRSKLLEISVPKEITKVKVSDGVALFCVDGEFKVLVTLGYRGHLSMWRILHLEFLVGERSGVVKLEESRRHALGADLERRMAATENPFLTLYSILHELCLTLVMDTVIRQVQALRQGRWKDAIRFELISDGTFGQGGSATSSQINFDGEADSSVLRTPGLKVIYWLDPDKNPGTSDTGTCPFFKIEPGPDLQIKCLHSVFVIDPLTGKEADFSLDQSCIDVEMLLLRAIDCNIYTRLLEIFKELDKDNGINQTPGDVQLQYHVNKNQINYEKQNKASDMRMHDGTEVLRVRAYGSSYFTLGINIRNGRILLHSSKNIISPKALIECEEALNQGSMTAAKTFINLRSSSILHLFACIGRFLGLEVFEHGFNSVKLPSSILDGSNSLFMGFPECGSSYFLLMQLDKEFKPCLKLIEAQLDSTGKTEVFDDMNDVTRVKSLDVSRMNMCFDDLNLSLIENDVNDNGTAEHGLLSASTLEGSMLRSNHPITFSSIVDEVFELEKGSNGQGSYSTFGLPPASHLLSGIKNPHGIKDAISSPNWEGASIAQTSATNFKNSMQSGSINLMSTNLGRSQVVKKLPVSKSDQDLPALRSPHSCGLGGFSLDEDQVTVSGHRSARILSPPRHSFHSVSVSSFESNEHKISENFLVSGSNSWVASPVSSIVESAVLANSNQQSVPRHEKTRRKRTISAMMQSLPSLQYLEGSNKRRKTIGLSHPQLPRRKPLISCVHPCKTEGYSFANLIAEAHKGNAPPSVYVSILLYIVRHCSLCIKHARLTSQMDALDAPYVEEVGLRSASSNLGLGSAFSNLWFRLPFARGDTWQCICLRLGKPGSLYWDVKIIDPHFKNLWELQRGSNNTTWGYGVRIANTSDVDSHIRYDSEGVVLSYNSVEPDSVKKLVADIQRLSNAKKFSLGMRKLLGARTDEKFDESITSIEGKAPSGMKILMEGSDKFSDMTRRAFRIEAVGPMSLWFSFGSGVLARFVVEWESNKEGCTMHVSPDQHWPHTKFLEDFVNGGEVASLLDCIRLTAGPLNALAAATRPARAAPVSGVPSVSPSTSSKQSGYAPSQGLHSSSNINTNQSSPGLGSNPGVPTPSGPVGTQNSHAAAMLAAAAAAAAGRGGPGIVPSSLLPIDVSVVLRGPYWIRIIYRKKISVDMRCFAGDQVWLQPATPPKVGQPVGGSLPCPQFRPFIMEHVAQELNGIDSNFPGAQQALGILNSKNPHPISGPQLPASPANRTNLTNTATISRTGNAIAALNRIGNALPGQSNLSVVNPLRRSPGSGVPAHVRGELNTAIIGLGDDGGYGGGWVPLVALKKVLRGILKYLGVLWLFAQLPDLLKEILGSILKDNEGALLNLDQEQPALRFFVGGYVFAVSVHRVQLLLQVISVKRFHHSQQQQPNSVTVQEELTQSEIGEICDYFSRRVASEPYDASRVASFITLLTLPISVLREFLKLIAWKKGLAQGQGADVSPAQKSRIELCLENHLGLNRDMNSANSSLPKSNIIYDRAHNSVDFALTVVLDHAHIPHINAAGGAAWLPYCVSVILRYSFGENPSVNFLGMEGSHGGRACWLQVGEWDKCRQRISRTVESIGSSSGDSNQGRLRVVADGVQKALNLCLQGLRDGLGMS
ncbi:mediator of RNA polymerase II transcription subunit 14-like isoform X2 [Primulina tabacum]|uniref:mediator of RNA polymerase II transcription subunit 14-like isoform X2 n=1 Tax=Primulina tabacum TaxID=48773 RepID=UPI003F593FEE